MLAGYVSTLMDASPTSRLPGWSTSFVGLLGGSGAITRVGSGDEQADDELEGKVDISALPHAKILRDATEAVEAISALLEESGNGWLAGAR